MVRLKKRATKEIILIIGLIVLVGFSIIFDTPIIKFVQECRNSLFDYFLLSITFASNVFIIFFFLTTLFLWNEHKRRWIVPLWLAAIFSALASLLLKVLIQRTRPFEAGVVSVLTILLNEVKFGLGSWNFSFPSFQAVLVFSAIPILNKEFKKFKYVWVIFAILVAFSRVYFGVHYLSDVLIGAIIGYLIGYLMVSLEEKYEPGKRLVERWM
ncbi:MAG: phosphatase PAP2 family protein [Candidatus Pacearchaeota archaeon]|jgi:undecaprenyl-diphosphatase